MVTKHSHPSYSENPNLFKTWAVSLFLCITLSQNGRLSSPGNIGFSFWDWCFIIAENLSSTSLGERGTMNFDIGIVHSSQAPLYSKILSLGGNKVWYWGLLFSYLCYSSCKCSNISRHRRCVACGSVKSPKSWTMYLQQKWQWAQSIAKDCE